MIPAEDLSADARGTLAGLASSWRELTSSSAIRRFPSRRVELERHAREFARLLRGGEALSGGAASRHSGALVHYDVASPAEGGGLLLEKRTRGALASAREFLRPRRLSFDLR